MAMRSKNARLNQSGFGLIEILVALVIGLLTTLVIMQVFTVFEGQKRSTMGSADAQTNGSIALYTIGRDVQMAGYGLTPVTETPLNCDPQPNIDDDNDPLTPSVPMSLSPFVLTDGGTAAGATDTLSIVYGSNPMGGVPVLVTSLIGSSATVSNNLGCQVGDTALFVSGSACAATKVTGPTDIAATPVASTPPDTTHVTLDSTASIVAAGIGAGANLACLGTWTRINYAVSNGNLEVSGTPRIGGIVNLQAQYGVSLAANSNQINQWVDADAVPWIAPSIADRNRIKAVRIAVIARNGVMERDNVSTACSSTTDPSPTGVCAWEGTAASPAPTVDLSNDANWQRYRYRVFETIIPLRNMIWAKDVL